MSDVDRLLREYIEAHHAGAEADPRVWLLQVGGRDRELLAALIDAYLEHAPRRRFDAAAFEDSPAAALTQALSRSLAGRSGLWPAVLPRLRNAARIRRRELVSELAARLGAQARRDKVEAYYHAMEQGTLPADGVSDAVLEALGRIVGQSRESLRRAGEALPAAAAPDAPAPAAPPAFARTGRAHPEPSDAPEAGAAEAPAGDWDEVDRLFRGGP